MKKITFLGLLVLSSQTFASTYVGSNKGAACTLDLDMAKKSASLKSGTEGFSVIARNSDIRTGQIIKLEGGDSTLDARITVTLDKKNEPMTAKLEEKKIPLTVYSTVLACSNFVKTK
ncbi:MAG: hypothetical protein ACXVLQ_17130 [Bacteriovorax sp.]